MYKNNQTIQPYVEKNLEKIIKVQEEKTGIKNFGIPEIKYGIPDDANFFIIKKNKIGGFYNQEKDFICLSTMSSIITPEFKLRNILAKLFSYKTWYKSHNVRNILFHELGHFYQDKLSESLGLGNYPNILDIDKGGTLGKTMGINFVSEGIAEYFERKITGEKDKFKNSEWPETAEELFKKYKHVTWDGGYHLIKPIIDEYGKKGIEYLIQYPPETEHFKELPDYQKRVLKILAEQTSSKK